MATHTTTISVRNGVRELTVPASTYTGGGRIGLDDEPAPTGQTTQMTFTLDVSACKSFYLSSTQNVAFKTNDSGSPANTINLVANKAYTWNTDSYDTFKLTSDVTTVYITNSSGSSATITCEAIYDVTP